MFSKTIRVTMSILLLVTSYVPMFQQYSYAWVYPSEDYDLNIVKNIIDTDLTWSTITYKIDYSIAWWVSATWVYLRDVYDSWLTYNQVISSSPDLSDSSILFSHISDQHILQRQGIELPIDGYMICHYKI